MNDLKFIKILVFFIEFALLQKGLPDFTDFLSKFPDFSKYVTFPDLANTLNKRCKRPSIIT